MGLFDDLFNRAKQQADEERQKESSGGFSWGPLGHFFDNPLSGKVGSIGYKPGGDAGLGQLTYEAPQKAKQGSADIQPASSVSYTPGPYNPDYSNSEVGVADGGNTPISAGGLMPNPVAQQQDPMSMLRDAIAKMQTGDNPYLSGLNEARSASLKAIADTRGTTNKNFDTSNKAIGDMYQKGQADTLAQGANLKQSNDALQAGLNGVYGNAVNTLQSDRSKEMADRADMLNRLGIQQAGLGNAGDTQTQAIANTTQAQTAAGQKAQQYGAADQTANTARANSLISEGTGRQAALRSQLAGVLGQLSGKELDINNQYATNSMNAQNQNYQDQLQRLQALYGMYDKEQNRALEQQKIIENSRQRTQMLRNMGGGSSGSGNGMTNIQDANNFISSQGGNPGDYNNAYTGSIMDYNNPLNPNPSESALLQSMLQKNPGLDRTQALQYIRNASNSSKYNTPSSGLTPQQQAMLLSY